MLNCLPQDHENHFRNCKDIQIEKLDGEKDTDWKDMAIRR